MRISSEEREEAIEDLLVTADSIMSSRQVPGHRSPLAKTAWLHVHLPEYGPTERWLGIATEALEAAALLRDGWNPGDPVEVRK